MPHETKESIESFQSSKPCKVCGGYERNVYKRCINRCAWKKNARKLCLKRGYSEAQFEIYWTAYLAHSKYYQVPQELACHCGCTEFITSNNTCRACLQRKYMKNKIYLTWRETVDIIPKNI